MVWFRPWGPQTTLLVGAGYLGLTVFAARFQQGSAARLLGLWAQSSGVDLMGRGNASLHSLLEALGQPTWKLPASLLVLLVLGAWVHRHRHADLWVVAGVTAIVARFWTYHRWYDDMLILLPMLALFRVARRGPHAQGRDIQAALLLALTWLCHLAPGGLYLLSSPWVGAYVAVQFLAWAAVLIFLLQQARQDTAALASGGQ
jgi:hypothetical protein